VLPTKFFFEVDDYYVSIEVLRAVTMKNVVFCDEGDGGATRSSETSVYNKPTRLHIAEDDIFHG
jgi:hypothetical protein